MISHMTLAIPYAVRNSIRRASPDQLSCRNEIEKADAIINRINEKGIALEYCLKLKPIENMGDEVSNLVLRRNLTKPRALLPPYKREGA